MTAEKTPENLRVGSSEPLMPIARNPAMADYANAPDKEAFLEQERKIIAEQLANLPVEPDFPDARESILERQRLLIGALSKRHHQDFRMIAVTRMQRLGGVMGGETVVMQLMFDENVKSEETSGETFFASRINIEGVQLNATSITFTEGFPWAFSVLKREAEDEFGKFGVDHPALSLPREALIALDMYRNHQNPELTLEQDPLTKDMAKLFDKRVHDVIHALFLYDNNALTKIFKKFGDDIFTVEQLFKDPNKVNYEFMVDKMFYLAWQDIYQENPEVKQEDMDTADNFLDNIDKFENFLNAKDPDKKDYNKRLANFVAFIGMRGLTHRMRYDGPEFKALSEKHPRLERVVELIPDNIKEYLQGIYSEEFGIKLPFKKNAVHISMEDILDVYTTGLLEEFRVSILEGRNSNWEDTYNAVMLLPRLPKEIRNELGKIEQKNFDTKSIVRLYSLFDDLETKFGTEVAEAFAKQVEVDPETGFYFKLKMKDVDFSESSKPSDIYHSKFGLLVQIPHDYPKPDVEVNLIRPKTLMQKEKGAVAHAKPGDIVLVNIQDRSLAEAIIKEATVGGKFDFDVFQGILTREMDKGNPGLGDVYPYSNESTLNTFDLGGGITRDEVGGINLTPGFYKTKRNVRKAFKIDGPVSLEGFNGSDARRIQYGAIAQNHIQAPGKLDVFPIDQASLGKFYGGVKRSKLSRIAFSREFLHELGLSQVHDNNEVVINFIKGLENVNTVAVYGPRGAIKSHKLSELI